MKSIMKFSWVLFKILFGIAFIGGWGHALEEQKQKRKEVIN